MLLPTQPLTCLGTPVIFGAGLVIGLHREVISLGTHLWKGIYILFMTILLLPFSNKMPLYLASQEKNEAFPGRKLKKCQF